MATTFDTDAPDAEVGDTFHEQYSGDYMIPLFWRGPTRFHILRGGCDEDPDSSPEGEKCSFGASVRRISSDGIEQYCGIHVPDEWLDLLGSERVASGGLVALEAACEKMVRGDGGRFEYSLTTEGGRDVDESNVGHVHECGDTALLTVEGEDGFVKSFCRRHARDAWVSTATLDVGLPEEPPDYSQEKFDRIEYVDLTTGRRFDTYDEWTEGVRDVYPDVLSAEQHVLIYDPEKSLADH